MRRAVLLFVKHPTPGAVKTRLAATLGPERASAAGLRVHLLPTLRDMDTEEDWKNVEY
jgi:glycosyltransferase A (GT-A) superfamily protein (DUF2064 family)